jgi:hypothetical protein
MGLSFRVRRASNVHDACMFDIMELSDDTLKKVLPKISIRMVSRLICAYPRAVGRTLLIVMSESMSPCTIDFLKEEMCVGRLPTIHQIREAEKEFVRTLKDEKLLLQSDSVHA